MNEKGVYKAKFEWRANLSANTGVSTSGRKKIQRRSFDGEAMSVRRGALSLQDNLQQAIWMYPNTRKTPRNAT